MNKFSPYVGAGLLAVLTLISGLIQGKMTNRFGVHEDMNVSREKLALLQKDLQANGFGERGQWRMVKTADMSQLVIDTLECQGYINASFVNSELPNVQIDGFIVLGPPGPISVHTPEICYDSRAYERQEERERVRIYPEGKSEDEFWALTMRTNNVNSDVLRVYYGFTDEGPWSAPESPRTTFGGGAKLYKMQLAATLPSDANLSEMDACKLFLQAFLPVVNKHLFAAPAE